MCDKDSEKKHVVVRVGGRVLDPTRNPFRPESEPLLLSAWPGGVGFYFRAALAAGTEFRKMHLCSTLCHCLADEKFLEHGDAERCLRFLAEMVKLPWKSFEDADRAELSAAAARAFRRLRDGE